MYFGLVSMFSFGLMYIKFPVSQESCDKKFAFPKPSKIFQPFQGQIVKDLCVLRELKDNHFLGKEIWLRSQGNMVGDRLQTHYYKVKFQHVQLNVRGSER